MILAMSRKFFIRLSCSNTCLFSARRNASTISHSGEGPLFSDASSFSNLGIPKRESDQQKKTAAIVSLLRDYRFTDALISKLEASGPSIFACCPKKNISPKLKFLESIGMSIADIPKLVIANPYLLKSSLKKKVIPCYNYLKNLRVCEEQLNRILKARPRILTVSLEKTIAPNVELLRGLGIPSYLITYCLTHSYIALSCSHEHFKSSVDQAIKSGLNPSTKMFILAVRVLCCNSKQQWAQKMEVYKGFVLSDEEILLAFKHQPWIMAISKKKIARGLGFFLKELGWSPAILASNPVLLLLSLDKRVIPRLQVMDILRKKGLLNNVTATPRSFIIGEKQFMEKYIYSYKDDYPELMDIYLRCSSSPGETS